MFINRVQVVRNSIFECSGFLGEDQLELILIFLRYLTREMTDSGQLFC